MALQTQQTTKTASATSTQTEATTTTKSDKKSQLRGMSFDEGTKALTPEAGKDPKKSDKKDDKGPPPEIEALGLKHVKVECTLSVWAALEEDEKANVITFLTKKDEECETSKKLKSSKVTISMGKHIEAADEKAVAENQKKADDNGARLADGKTAMGDKTIGVKEGAVDTKSTSTTKVTQVPVKEKKELKDHFDGAGSTFDSADYKPEDMQQGGVIALLDQAAKTIQQYLAIDPNAKVSFNVIASESHVPNPAEFKDPGSLAAARAANGVELAKAHFAALGIPLANLSFTTTNLGANGPKWDPKIGKHDAMYTAHQFVRLEVSAEVEVEGDKTEPQSETETTETESQDLDLIKMNVKDDRKKTKKSKNNFQFQKHQRVKKHPIRKFFKNLFDGKSPVSCPKW